MKVKNYLKIAKPSVKGSILVLFGIFNSRFGIGIETFTINLMYGPLAYLFIAFSGIMIIKLFQILNNPISNSNSKKRIILLSIILYLIGFILTIGNILDNLSNFGFNLQILIFTIFIGSIWIFLGFISLKYKKYDVLVNILFVSLVFSMGLFYGVMLNTFIIPLFIYFYFISILLLQISRELLKKETRKNSEINFLEWEIRYNQKKILIITLFFQILTILFLVFLLLITISNSILIFFLIIINIAVIILAGIFILESIISREIYHKISSIIKVGIFIELLTILILGG